jgi:acetoin utilization deacetylase AcuC-like enzyme
MYLAIRAMATEAAETHPHPMKTFYAEQMIADSGCFSPSAGKPREVLASWRALGLPLDVVEPTPATVDELCRAHDPQLVRAILAGRRSNGFGNRSLEVAATLPWTSGAMLSAARWAITHGGVAAAPCSGFHHASFRGPSGFCTFNGLMITALALRHDGTAKKVGILDFDQHYGDGTDDILKTLGIDWVTHTTAGREHFTAKDAPRFLASIEGWVDAMMGSDVLLYQAGADPHIEDPLGGFLTTEQLRERDRLVFGAAKERHIPLVWNLAGGYQKPLRKVLDIHDNTARECVAAYDS